MKIYYEMRDLSRYQNLPFSDVISNFIDKFKPYIKDEVDIRQGTSYIEFEISPTRKSHRISRIRFLQDGDVVVYPNLTSRSLPKRVAKVKPPIEDLSEEDLDYVIERILGTSYFPRVFLKK